MKELILLTGCQHTGHPSDASPWDVARALHGKVVETYPIASVMLPRSLDAAIKAMAELLAVYEPRLSLCLGPFAEGERTLIPHAAVNAAVIPGDSRCPSLAGTFGLSPVDRLCATNYPCSLQTSRQNLEPSGGLLPGLLRQLVGRRPASPDRPCCETGRVAFTSGWLPPLADGQPRGSKVPKAETGPTTA